MQLTDEIERRIGYRIPSPHIDLLLAYIAEREAAVLAKLARQEPAAWLVRDERDKGIYRMALTLAHNLCVQRSDCHNADDETDEARAAYQCAVLIATWLDATDAMIADMLNEAGIETRAALASTEAPPQADRQRVPQAFTDWLCREMPPGTIISDPAWWAPKIARAMLAAAPEAPAQGSTFPADAPRNIIWNSLRPDHPVEWLSLIHI